MSSGAGIDAQMRAQPRSKTRKCVSSEPEYNAELTPCVEIMRRYELMRYNHFKEKYEYHV